MEIWVYSWTFKTDPLVGGGALSTRYTVAGLRQRPRGHTVREFDSLDALQDALRAGKPDVLVHHNTREMEAVQALAEKARVPYVVSAQIGLDCGTGLHVAFPAEKESAWNTLAGLPYQPFGHFHRRCSLGMTAKELMVKKGSALQKLRWLAEVPARRARIASRLKGLEKAAGIVAISPTIKELLEENGVRLAANRAIEVVPQPVDERLFAVRKQAASKRKNILFLGGMSWLKGAHVLLEAFGGVKDPEARLQFAGNLREADFDERMVAKWKQDKRIEWLGKVQPERAAQRYAEADLVVFPSICIESFGRVWAEACATGTPVLAFKGRGGAADFLEHGKTGWLAELSVESLRQGMETLLADEGLRQRLGQGAREMALNKLHPKKIVEQLEGVYERACR